MNKLLWLPEHPTRETATPCLARHGTQWVSAPPPARNEPFVAVVPAARVQWHHLSLPRAARGKWREAAAALLEPTLMQEIEDCVFHVSPPRADGTRAVAVLEAAWVAEAAAWLARQGLSPTRWVAETDLLAREPGSWMLFARQGEWLLCDGARHLLLDLTADDSAPALFRAALEAGATPHECRVAGLPAAGQLAERHSPTAPLWLATLGVRARTLEGTQWLHAATDTLDLAPHATRRWQVPSLQSWRVPVALAAAALLVQLAGVALQTAQWRSEEAALKTEIAQRQSALDQQAAVLNEHPANRALAAQLERLATLDITPRQIQRLDAEGARLQVELDARNLDVATLQARAKEAGGVLTTSPRGAPLLRFGPTGDAR